MVANAGGVKDESRLLLSGEDNNHVMDVKLRSFRLPNKKVSGADLLVDADLVFAQGRRYGLLVRYGCGKTTLMELVAERKIKSIPKNISLLLVWQEIIGD